MISLAEQIAHIKEHQSEFDAHQLGPSSVDDYFQEYAYPNEDGELYLALCSDLGLEPRKSGGGIT